MCPPPPSIGMAVLQLPELGPEDAAFRHPARRRLHLRAPVAFARAGGDAGGRHIGLGFPAAAAHRGGVHRRLRRDPVHAGLGAHVLRICRAGGALCQRRGKPAFRLHERAVAAAKATPSSNRSSMPCASPSRASIWRMCWSSSMAPMIISWAASTPARRSCTTITGSSTMPGCPACERLAGASCPVPAAHHPDAGTDPGKLHRARRPLLLGPAGLYPRRPGRRLLRRALSALSLHPLCPARPVRGHGVHGRQLLAQAGPRGRHGAR